MISSFADIPAGADALIVAGGGSLMDEAKHIRARQRPTLNLILMPSIWGSGAESSPIAVLNREGGKEIAIGDEFLPDTVIYWPELLATVPPARARHTCGDAWSHTLEAFLSPLACDSLRGERATLIGEMLRLPLGTDPRWFQASARASALQPRASVGLVHDIGLACGPVATVAAPAPATAIGGTSCCAREFAAGLGRRLRRPR